PPFLDTTRLPPGPTIPKLDLNYSARPHSGKELGRAMGSAFWLQTEEAQRLRLHGVGFRQLLERRPRRIRDDLVGVAYPRRQVRQQAGKAVRRRPAGRLVRTLLRPG